MKVLPALGPNVGTPQVLRLPIRIHLALLERPEVLLHSALGKRALAGSQHRLEKLQKS